MNILLPAVWLIVLLAGLPQLSETIYTPSLPTIALSLHTSASMIEYTLTIYLFGFAIGTLVWGKLSDKFGRKPGILLGLILFGLGCIGCYCSETITALMLSRFAQAFGGSIGSVLGQAICRDAFQGRALGKVYAVVASSLAIFPAIGPVLGGFIAEHFGWRSIFICLLLVTIALIGIVMQRLPETHLREKRTHISILQVTRSLIRDKKVLGFGILVAGCNGISFSYYAEGPFYLIKILGLSPSQYGLSFVALAVSTLCGGLFSRHLHQTIEAKTIMQYGLTIILFATILFSLFLGLYTMNIAISTILLVVVTILMMMLTMFGICMVISNALAMALVDYKWCTGTASSLFGFFYYMLISLFTFGMGYLHNGTLWIMPSYFLSISIVMILVNRFLISQ